MDRQLLITGFDPFDGKTVNPSWQAVEQLPEAIGYLKLCKLQIPTVFGKAAAMVLTEAECLQPDVILCIGMAVGRHAVTPERIAVNIRNARIPDNKGNRPQGALAVPVAPAAYFSTVPVKEMAEAIRAQSIPAAVSNTAGTYVCNDVFFTLLHHYAGTKTKVGFIHVPCLPEQGSPSMSMECITAALTAAIEVC